MRHLIAVGMFVALTLSFSTPSYAGCCSYGCCDCGCVAKKAQVQAAVLGRHLKGNLSSVTIDASDNKQSKASWACSTVGQKAYCYRQ